MLPKSGDRMSHPVALRAHAIPFPASFEGISWSHKFGSLNRRRRHDPSMVITSCPHLEVRDWLKRLNLEDCYEKFKQFNGVEDFLYYSEADIKKLGIRNNAHRARIVSSLVALREKPSTGSLHRSETLKKSMRHSMAADLAKKSATGTEDAATYECLTVGKTKQSKSLGDLLEMSMLPGNNVIGSDVPTKRRTMSDSKTRATTETRGSRPVKCGFLVFAHFAKIDRSVCISQDCENYMSANNSQTPTFLHVVFDIVVDLRSENNASSNGFWSLESGMTLMNLIQGPFLETLRNNDSVHHHHATANQ
ncbi:uncharacterized protein LOC129741558 [Uranotaenia lowii]|uniref:uncharacterized protein LOC129741558 n=1 Tax=Uranotaenia lowii TaxID=190385 RepID=UPI002478A0AC|nr:uncharacterized protein LOC129741558 [Uranotaenia lowii]